MSAAAARRRKQLQARQKQQAEDGHVVLSSKLQSLLDASNDEGTAYEALQLAQSLTRKQVHSGQYAQAAETAHASAQHVLQKGFLSVAAPLLTLLVDVLRETHTEETDEWRTRLLALHATFQEQWPQQKAPRGEITRLHRLQREWLRKCVAWSSELGRLHMGHYSFLKALGLQEWDLSSRETELEVIQDLQCDAVFHMALAEEPQSIAEWLKTLLKPTPEQTKQGHSCPPAVRDGLFTRAILLFCLYQNLRDANILLRIYATEIEERTLQDLAKSYTNKEDGQAPSHVQFANMLVQICQKDVRTGPLYSWLLRSFKKELDLLPKANLLQGWTSKIGQVYFNIQPPPSMLSMMENMMGGLGGGMNPAMMQAALSGMGGGM